MKKMIAFKLSLKSKITKANDELASIKYEYKV
jgi:hypothetical protein